MNIKQNSADSIIDDFQRDINIRPEDREKHIGNEPPKYKCFGCDVLLPSSAVDTLTSLACSRCGKKVLIKKPDEDTREINIE